MLKKIIDRHPIIKSIIKKLMLLLVPDLIYIRRQYFRQTGKKLNLKNPKTFKEKIQWIKLHWRDDIATVCADKYKVRDYVKERIGEETLIPLYGVYDRVEDINLNILPDSFVLKVNHGCGQNIICPNKNDIDWDKVRKLLKIYMRKNHYYYGREWAYKNIVPKIICEEYLIEEAGPPKDYKIFCFNGEPRIIQVDIDRFQGHKRNFYDLEWNLLPFHLGQPQYQQMVVKPLHLDKMIKYAYELAKNMIFVSVDLYYVNNKIYFGEMTFTPEYGMTKFDPEKYDAILGSYLKLPGYNMNIKKKTIQRLSWFFSS